MSPKAYVIADTHFGHTNIIEYESRPFSNAEQMDATIIQKWNDVVKENDDIYILGDFALCGADRIREIITCLKGQKYLIPGNHDKRSRGFWLKAGFVGVFKEPHLLGMYMLSHYPKKNPPFHNIHGHIHSKTCSFTAPQTHTCVSVEVINYAPVELDLYGGRNLTEEESKVYEAGLKKLFVPTGRNYFDL